MCHMSSSGLVSPVIALETECDLVPLMWANNHSLFTTTKNVTHPKATCTKTDLSTLWVYLFITIAQISQTINIEGGLALSVVSEATIMGEQY